MLPPGLRRETPIRRISWLALGAVVRAARSAIPMHVVRSRQSPQSDLRAVPTGARGRRRRETKRIFRCRVQFCTDSGHLTGASSPNRAAVESRPDVSANLRKRGPHPGVCRTRAEAHRAKERAMRAPLRNPEFPAPVSDLRPACDGPVTLALVQPRLILRGLAIDPLGFEKRGSVKTGLAAYVLTAALALVCSLPCPAAAAPRHRATIVSGPTVSATPGTLVAGRCRARNAAA
jgi:hypothetical protein